MTQQITIVAVLGAGKIGEAVARALAKSPKVSQVMVTKRDISTLRRPLPRKIEATTDNVAAAKKADLLVIAVKAADAGSLLDSISSRAKCKVVVSLMAAVHMHAHEQ
jgi:pyrroline-5-carboxylate reductase